MEALRRAAEAHDVDAVIALLAPDIVVRSPITQRIRFEGIDQASELFQRVFRLVDDIRFYETVGEGEPTQVVFWRGRVGGQYLEEANLLRLDDDGRIREMTVFMRPVPGLLAFTTGIASLFAGRGGRGRELAVRAMFGFVELLYRAGEPLGVHLTGVGEPVPRGER